MVITQVFHLEKKDYFKILINLYLRKKWWLLLWIWAFMIYDFGRDADESFLFFRVFGILYPLIVVYRLWRYANSEENRNFFLEKQLQIEEEGISNVISGTPSDAIPKQLLIKAIELKKFYLLYISKNSFIAIPKSVFNSQENMVWFRRAYGSLFK